MRQRAIQTSTGHLRLSVCLLSRKLRKPGCARNCASFEVFQSTPENIGGSAFRPIKTRLLCMLAERLMKALKPPKSKF